MRMRDHRTDEGDCAHRISTAYRPLLIPCAMHTPHTHGWHLCYSTLQRTAVLYAGLKLYFDDEDRSFSINMRVHPNRPFIAALCDRVHVDLIIWRVCWWRWLSHRQRRQRRRHAMLHRLCRRIRARFVTAKRHRRRTCAVRGWLHLLPGAIDAL